MPAKRLRSSSKRTLFSRLNRRIVVIHPVPAFISTRVWVGSSANRQWLGTSTPATQGTGLPRG